MSINKNLQHIGNICIATIQDLQTVQSSNDKQSSNSDDVSGKCIKPFYPRK